MKYFLPFLIILFSGRCFTQGLTGADTSYRPLVHAVKKTSGRMVVDGDWSKPAWKKVQPVRLKNYMGKVPAFKPVTEAKISYDDNNVYVIFRVKDRFVKSTVRDYNGNVSGDACVEFFFAPDSAQPLHYFNLEVNAGGTPLLFYVTTPWTEFKKLDSADISKITIAHSLPAVIDREITEPVTWTVEYRIPFTLLEKFSTVSRPSAGTVWRANFYKTASRSSNPHWITWSPVNNPTPNFHLPQFFGVLRFE